MEFFKYWCGSYTSRPDYKDGINIKQFYYMYIYIYIVYAPKKGTTTTTTATTATTSNSNPRSLHQQQSFLNSNKSLNHHCQGPFWAAEAFTHCYASPLGVSTLPPADGSSDLRIQYWTMILEKVPGFHTTFAGTMYTCNHLYIFWI